MRNVKSLVALGAYSHETLKAMVAQTGIEYHRLEKGIGHYFTDPQSFAQVEGSAALMRGLGVERRVVTRDELLQIEPALRPFASEIVGGTYTASDESGDARVFTQALAEHFVAQGGVTFEVGQHLVAIGLRHDHIQQNQVMAIGIRQF